MAKTLTKIIYIILFVLLIFHPHFITGHIFNLPLAYTQTLVNLIIIWLAYVVYLLHQREMNHKEKARKRAEKKSEISHNKLIDSYKHIGLLNRRLPLLRSITTDLLKRRVRHNNQKKDIFHELLTTAVVSVVKTEWGMVRFVDSASGNTIKEFVYINRKNTEVEKRISNKQLLTTKFKKLKYGQINGLHAIPTTDENSPVQCFLIFPKKIEYLNNELTILQSIVDQAQLFYQYLFNNK